MLLTSRSLNFSNLVELFFFLAMRFYIDCDDLNVGDVLKFSIHCYASTNNKPFLLDTDDNDNKYYQVNCTPKLNVWAAKAAQELKNFAPIVKYNCLHKDPGSTATTSKENPWSWFVNTARMVICVKSRILGHRMHMYFYLSNDIF